MRKQLIAKKGTSQRHVKNAFWAIFGGFGLLFYMLLVSRYQAEARRRFREPRSKVPLGPIVTKVSVPLPKGPKYLNMKYLWFLYEDL